MQQKDNPIMNAPGEAFVCFCGKVDKGTVLSAISDGNDTLGALKRATGICPPNNDCAQNNPLGRCCCTEVNALLQAARNL